MVEFSKKSSRTKAKKKNSKQAKNTTNKRQSKKRTGKTKTKTRNRSKTQTVSKSHTATPTKEKSEGRKERRLKDFKEKEPDSEGRKTEDATRDSVTSKSKGSQGSQLDPPKKVEVKNVEPDAESVKRMLKKVKNAPRAPQLPLDEKSKLLMDRVVRKPYPLKYASKSKQELLMDEKSSFFKVSVPSPSISKKQVEEEDNYDSCPKLADVLKMTNLESIYTSDGVPFWAEYMEPTLQDMVGIDEAVSVGSAHLEAYNDKELVLKTCQDKTPVILNPFQPLSALKRRDEPHFHPHLVFSNTVRSMINAQNNAGELSGGGKNKKEDTMPIVKAKDSKTVVVPVRSPVEHFYLRSEPIRTARESRKNSPKCKNTVTTTNTTSVDG